MRKDSSSAAPQAATSGPACTDWERGYFCAVAALIREHGLVQPDARELFGAGGDPTHADPEDQVVFREHNLMPPERADSDSAHRPCIGSFEADSQEPWG